MCWPCIAIGVRPIETPTAITALTRGGIIREENSGAIRNSGVTRASTRMKPASSLPASFAEQLVHEPTIVGMAV